VKELAGNSEISSASTSAVVDRLEGVGLVSRQRNDRRIDPEQIDPLSERNATLAVEDRIATLAVELDDERADTVRQFLAELADAVDSECHEPESGWPTASR
jgi:DNA-binding MarR family transcriptional regulator